MKIRADQRVGLLLGGVLLLAFVAIGTTVALPASDPTLQVDEAAISDAQAKGMEVFRSEGLWYCEPAYIRRTSIDRSRFGAPATTPSDVAGRSPVLLGTERLHDVTRPTAEQLAEACGVVGLSDEELAAVDAFLNARL